MGLDVLMSGPLDKYKGQGIGKSEDGKNIFAEQSPEFKRAIAIYDFCVNGNIDITGRVQKALTEVLSPNDITRFLEETKTHNEKQLTLFLEKLIQNSHAAGYDNFILHHNGLMLNLPQTKPIHLKIMGDVDKLTGEKIHAEIYGDFRQFSSLLALKDSELTLYGRINVSRGAKFYNTTFKTPEEETFNQLILLPRGHGNTIKLIDGQGNTIEHRT